MKRNNLIEEIKKVIPAVDSSNKSVIQSNCVVFQNGMIFSFNDQICIRGDSDFPFEGSIEANPFLSLLENMDTEEIKMTKNDDTLEVKGKRRKGRIPIQEEIKLPVGLVGVADEWFTISDTFIDDLCLASQVAGTDDNKYTLSCVHITSDYMEACDNIQYLRTKRKTGLGKKLNKLIPSSIGNTLKKYKLNSIGFSDSWIHFRNEDGFIFSVREHIDNYPDMSSLTDVQGSEVDFPKTIGEIANRTATFSKDGKSDEVLVHLSGNGKMTVESTNGIIWYEEKNRVNYSGADISFYIYPSICSKLIEEDTMTVIKEDRLKIETDSYTYVAVLQEKEV